MEHSNLHKVADKFDIMSNRLSLAIIIASIIIGSSLVVGKPPVFYSVYLVEAGYVSAMILGLFLAYSIIKSGKY
jgi:ubiquinone biosynthesis protein